MVDSVSTSSHPIDLKEASEEIVRQNKKWVSEQRKKNEKQNEIDAPRNEMAEKVRRERQAATLEKIAVTKMQGKYNYNLDYIEGLLQQNRELEAEIEGFGNWKKKKGEDGKFVWKKEFACDKPTKFEIEDREAKMKANGYVKNYKGEWYLPAERKKLNDIIAHESRGRG